MTKMLAGAIALALLGGSAALAQDIHDQQGGYRAGDANRNGGDHNQGGDHSQGGDHRHGRTVCTWRHHHRVCARQHW